MAGRGESHLLGESLERFYICLSSCSSSSSKSGQDLEKLRTLRVELIQAYLALEDCGQPLLSASRASNSADSVDLDAVPLEPPSVYQEILADARRKAFPLIRSPFIEQINTILSSSRKRLKSHLTGSNKFTAVIIDVLGVWSDIILEVSGYQFAKDSVCLLLSSVYPRVIEIVLDTTTLFQQEKCASFTSSRPLQDGDLTLISLQNLDSIVTQLTTIRAIINKHYQFHYDSFAYCFQDDAHSTVIDRLVLPSLDELLKWKELDLLYLQLERMYLGRSLYIACKEGGRTMLCIDSAFVVYIPQLFEDIFFICGKTLDRAVSTYEEYSVYHVASFMLEQLLHCPADDHEPSSSLIYELLVRHRISLFRRAFVEKELGKSMLPGGGGEGKETGLALFDRVIKVCLLGDSGQLIGSTNNSVPTSVQTAPGSLGSSKPSAINDPSKTTAPPAINPSPDSSNTNSNSSNNNININIGSGNGSKSSAASNLVSGVNQWLTNFASPFIDLNDNPPTTLPGAVSSPPADWKVYESTPTTVTKLSTPPVSQAPSIGSSVADIFAVSNLEELLLKALDAIDSDDDREDQYLPRTNGGDSNGSSSSQSGFLHRADTVIVLNTLQTVVQGVTCLHDRLEEVMHNQQQLFLDHRGHHSRQSMLSVLLDEYRRTARLYRSRLDSELQSLARREFESFPGREKLDDFLSSGFVITGQIMEDRWAAQILRITSSIYLQHAPIILPSHDAGHGQNQGQSQSQSQKHVQAHGHRGVLCETLSAQFLFHAAKILCDHILERVLRQDFTEWGALLLYEEVQVFLHFLEGLAKSEDVAQIKRQCQRLVLACKIMTLDAPADIRRYNLDKSMFSEQEVRHLLGRRIEFNKDAVSKVKITFIAAGQR